MRSRALNRVFNRALIDLEYRRSLLDNLRATLRAEGVPEHELRLLEALAPRTLRELAQALETVHAQTYH
ncbi:hypothetical protein [Truepera radiovictrix]|uniref:Uncharacterized protein n=1 Tax=Truepera radiovictrix (strain DSM 17093 / CIP 108686 / LMG 22925 / RQ-24) TaxID=649638 RepID=D7CWH9_TRURR|nr:hypothetical protein [Truepera radiovictrix]ADI14378.1 hypothetical protein Trad_1255 [Truepera radiovictrix DSM 17093]WMT57065.1 hypothetical protein RCV51_13730 [Truepera radiovictrix]